jgi:ABC-type amino acid transport system permease subunit
MTNKRVKVIKTPSLAYVIDATEITYFSTKVITYDFEPVTTYLFVALLYFTLTSFTSNIMGVVERKFRIPGYMGGE